MPIAPQPADGARERRVGILGRIARRRLAARALVTGGALYTVGSVNDTSRAATAFAVVIARPRRMDLAAAALEVGPLCVKHQVRQ